MIFIALRNDTLLLKIYQYEQLTMQNHNISLLRSYPENHQLVSKHFYPLTSNFLLHIRDLILPFYQLALSIFKILLLGFTLLYCV